MQDDRDDLIPDTTDTAADIEQAEFIAAVSPPDLRGRLNIRVEQLLQKEIEDIAEDSRYPLNSPSAVVRFCLRDGLERLRRWKPGKTLLGQIKAAQEMLLRDKLQCEALELLTRLDERVDWYISNGYYDEVLGLVASVESHFADLPNDFWAKYIRDEIYRRVVLWQSKIDELRVNE